MEEPATVADLQQAIRDVDTDAADKCKVAARALEERTDKAKKELVETSIRRKTRRWLR